MSWAWWLLLVFLLAQWRMDVREYHRTLDKADTSRPLEAEDR